MNQSPKRKSSKRFEQFNHLCDVVLPSLPGNEVSHRAALLVFFRHAGPSGGFKLSAGRLAAALGIKERRTRAIFNELREWGLIEHSPKHDTPVVKAHRITFRQYTEHRKAHHHPQQEGCTPVP